MYVLQHPSTTGPLSLDEREQLILCARYTATGPRRSLRQIGKRLGLPAERVRQIETRALSKLDSASRAVDNEDAVTPAAGAINPGEV